MGFFGSGVTGLEGSERSAQSEGTKAKVKKSSQDSSNIAKPPLKIFFYKKIFHFSTKIVETLFKSGEPRLRYSS